MWRVGLLLILTAQIQTEGKLESDEDTGESGDQDLRGEYNITGNHTQLKEEIEDQTDDSAERIGAAVTQVVRHPYAAALLKNDSYVCSAIILNTYWLLTLSKCFKSFPKNYELRLRWLNVISRPEFKPSKGSIICSNHFNENDNNYTLCRLRLKDNVCPFLSIPNLPPWQQAWQSLQELNLNVEIISLYVTHRYLGNYTIRVGSSYNNKGGAISKIKMLINNFDLKVSAAKLQKPLELTSQIQPVLLPKPDEDVSLGYLATMIAWTPTGHIRVVNAPIIDSSICESSTKLLPGRYICVGGVQDPNRHFCRKDNGGAVIQNNTLIAITSFLHTCALYTKTHAFPKVSSFSRWLDSVIWDENNRPTTTITSSTSTIATKSTPLNATESVDRNVFVDPSKYMLTLPFDPINVPLEPAEDNSVIPRMSLYESYLQNLQKAKTSTTADPNGADEKKEWLEKFGKSILMMPPQVLRKKYDSYDYK